MRFSESILHTKVYSHNNRLVGHLVDLVISFSKEYPLADAAVIKFDEISYIGKISLLEPAQNIKLIVTWSELKYQPGKIQLSEKEDELETKYLGQDEILVSKNIIDSVILTAKGNSLGRVNDAVFFEKNGQLELFGLSVGIIGIVAKLGLELPIELIERGFGRAFAETVVNWKYVSDYHPHNNEMILNVSEPVEAEGKIEWLESKEEKKHTHEKPPFIIVPWLFLEKMFKRNKRNK